jgi:hypothetical protein
MSKKISALFLALMFLGTMVISQDAHARRGGTCPDDHPKRRPGCTDDNKAIEQLAKRGVENEKGEKGEKTEKTEKTEKVG